LPSLIQTAICYASDRRSDSEDMIEILSMPPNHALQRTAAGRRGCNRRVSSPPSRSLGRQPHMTRTGKILGLSSGISTLVLVLWDATGYFQKNHVDRAGRNRPARADAETRRRHTMNILLWVLQVLAALLYGASGVMKVFMFDKVSEGVPSFGALPREAWMTLGILELVCTIGLIVPAAFHWKPLLTVVAATVLAIESLVFVWVHVQYREISPIILSCVLGLLTAFIAYGRMVLKPIV